MPTELDELDDLAPDMRADRSANPGKYMRSSPKNHAAAVARSHGRPKWKHQLAMSKMAATKLKAKLTT